MKNGMNRRDFIKGVGGAAVFLGFPYAATLLGAGIAPSERITLGFIGVGMQGRRLLWEFLHRRACRVVAVCDADEQKLRLAQSIVGDFYADRTGRSCAGYRDFRAMLSRSDIDGVVIATPEHWHGVMVVAACRAGKDIYCEKPLALTIDQAKRMVRAVRRHGRVLQTGSMQRSDARFRQACELVRNGCIGEVKTVSVSIMGGGFPMIPIPCDLPAEPAPGYLDWDGWVGPAPWRPFNSRLSPSVDVRVWPHWRDYEEFAGGLMTDWGAHHFDIAQWGLGMDSSGPVEVHPPDGRNFRMLTYIYASGVTVTRDDGRGYRSVLFTGTGGEVEVSRDNLRTLPSRLRRRRIGPNDVRLYRSDDHYLDWLDCVRSRRQPICDVEIGCRSATVCHLGIIAHKLGRGLKWDPAGQRFVGDAEAERMLSRPMRDGWRIV